MRTSIVVPIYNEVENIPQLVEQISAVMDVMGPEACELILINDGSNDGSAEVLDQFAVAG